MFQNIYFLNSVTYFRILLNRMYTGAMFSIRFPYRETETSRKNLQSPNIRVGSDLKECLVHPWQKARGSFSPRFLVTLNT